MAQHRFILINFLLFSAAVQFCKGRYTNTSLWLWLWLWLRYFLWDAVFRQIVM